MTKPNACSICDCIPPKFDKDFAQQAILNVVCDIAGAIQSGSITNNVNISISGNTSGTAALISTGTAFFAGGNNITLSQAGQSITISANAELGVDLSISGNTSGTATLLASGTAVLAGGNNITLSQSGSRITISGPNMSGPDITIGGNTSGTLTLISSGTMLLAGGNNITLSQNGQSVTISGANAVNASLGGNTSGTLTLISSGTLVLAGGNNVTLSQNGQSVTVSAGGASVVLNRFMPYVSPSLGVENQDTFHMMWMTVPTPIAFDRIMSHAFFSVSTSSNSSWAVAISHNVGIYSRNGTALNLISSTSLNNQFSDLSGGSFANISGWRHVPIVFSNTMTLSAGEYWVGMYSHKTRTGPNWVTANDFAALLSPNNTFNGSFGAVNQSEQMIPGFGIYSLSTSSDTLQAQYAVSDFGLSAFGGSNQRITPFIVFFNGAS